MGSYNITDEGTIIHEKNLVFPLYKLKIYGDKVLCQKLSKKRKLFPHANKNCEIH